MAGSETRNRILDAAENLFALKGFGWTSLRMITREAGVNLAAIHYHFGSKEALIEAVCARRTEPLTRERIALLDAVECEAGEGPLPLEPVLEAFIGPALRMPLHPEGGWRIFPRLLGQALAEPHREIRELFHRLFGEERRRFGAALQRALPELTREEVVQRMHFMVGAMTFSLALRDPGSAGPQDPPALAAQEAALDHLVRFIAAGMRVSSVAPAGGKRA